MKKDLTIGGIGARSTSVRRKIMKRVCKENVNEVKTNIVLSDIADIDPSYLPYFIIGILKKDTIIPNGKTLTINDNEVLIIETSKTLINYGTIINNGGSQGGIYIVDFSKLLLGLHEGGGILENNGTIINNASFANTNIVINNKDIFSVTGSNIINNGTINNNGVLQLSATGSSSCSFINTEEVVNNGTIKIDNNAVLTNDGGLLSNYSNIDVQKNGHIDISGSDGLIRNSGTITNYGDIKIHDAAKLSNYVVTGLPYGTLNNNGSIYVYTYGNIDNTHGTITNTTPGTINIANGSGGCGTGSFIKGSYTGTTGTGCTP